MVWAEEVFDKHDFYNDHLSWEPLCVFGKSSKDLTTHLVNCAFYIKICYPFAFLPNWKTTV